MNALDLGPFRWTTTSTRNFPRCSSAWTTSRQRIDETVSALTAQRNEFAAVTSNMAEALVLLNARGEVLSVNRAAEKLLGLPRSVPARASICWRSNRNFQLSEAMEAALRGENAEQEMEMNGRHYRCVASPVKDEGRVRRRGDAHSRRHRPLPCGKGAPRVHRQRLPTS